MLLKILILGNGIDNGHQLRATRVGAKMIKDLGHKEGAADMVTAII